MSTEQSRTAEVAPAEPATPEPLPPKPQEADAPALDLQALRLTVVTATPVVERLRVRQWSDDLWDADAKVLNEVLDGLTAALDEVERLSREVATWEAAAGHALDAAREAHQRADGLHAELERALDDRAAAYLLEVRVWDLLGRAADYLPADHYEQPVDHALRQVRHDVAAQLASDPSREARALFDRLRTAETVCEIAQGVPDLLGEGNFSAAAIDQTKVSLLAAIVAWKTALVGEVQ